MRIILSRSRRTVRWCMPVGRRYEMDLIKFARLEHVRSVVVLLIEIITRWNQKMVVVDKYIYINVTFYGFWKRNLAEVYLFSEFYVNVWSLYYFDKIFSIRSILIIWKTTILIQMRDISPYQFCSWIWCQNLWLLWWK